MVPMESKANREITVHPATLFDMNEVVALWVTLMRERAMPFHTTGPQDIDAFYLHMVDSVMNPNKYLFIVRGEEGTVGFISGGIGQAPYGLDVSGVCDWMYLTPDYRNLHSLETVIAHAYEWVTEHGAKLAETSVPFDRIPAYKRLGYEVVSVRMIRRI